MKNIFRNRSQVIAIVGFSILLFVIATTILIAGSVTYGPGGTYRSRSTAFSRACTLSDQNQQIYYVYYVSARGEQKYSGFCDKVGGGGTEPQAVDEQILEGYGPIIWPSLAMMVAGFVLGVTRSRKRL